MYKAKKLLSWNCASGLGYLNQNSKQSRGCVVAKQSFGHHRSRGFAKMNQAPSVTVESRITNGSSRNHLCRSDCSRNVDYTGTCSMLSSKILVQWTQILLRVLMPPSPIKQYEPHYSPSPSTLSCLAVKKCMYFIPFASLSPTDTPLSSSPGVFIPLSCIPFAVAIYIRSFPPFLSLPPPLSSKLYQLSPWCISFYVEFMWPSCYIYLLLWPFLRSII